VEYRRTSQSVTSMADNYRQGTPNYLYMQQVVQRCIESTARSPKSKVGGLADPILLG
jgi:hypothetical protein